MIYYGTKSGEAKAQRSSWWLVIEDSGSVLENFQNVELITSSINFNYYRDFRINDHFAPYLGFGVGRIHSELEFPEKYQKIGKFKSNDTFAYQFMVGLTYLFNDKHRINLGYRHHALFTDLEYTEYEDFQYDYSAGNYNSITIL